MRADGKLERENGGGLMEHALRQLKFPAAKGGKYFGRHMQNWFLPLRLGHGGATLAFMNLPLEKKFKIWKNKLAFIRNSLRKRDSVGVLGSPAAAGRAREMGSNFKCFHSRQIAYQLQENCDGMWKLLRKPTEARIRWSDGRPDQPLRGTFPRNFPRNLPGGWKQRICMREFPSLRFHVRRSGSRGTPRIALKVRPRSLSSSSSFTSSWTCPSPSSSQVCLGDKVASLISAN